MSPSSVPLAGLIVLDGWGLNPRADGNAVAMARTPILDALMRDCPHATLVTWGESVGLPPGQMGNSEVGHLNLGAGRIVYQDLTKIDRAIEDGSLKRNPVLRDALSRTLKRGRALHFIGLHSPGGVHSHLRHLHALLRIAAEAGVERILVHAISDGRDVPPRSEKADLEATGAVFREIGRGRFSTLTGRYFAMDRDKRWDRTEKAYRAMAAGEGLKAKTAIGALEMAYARGENDEFIQPTVIETPGENGSIARGDTVLMFNFRPDRMRQIVRALADPDFDAFPRPRWPLDPDQVCMTSYDETFPYPVLFEDAPLRDTIGEVVSREGIRQLRMAETEKYAHVTYFFNGSQEVPFPGEERGGADRRSGAQARRSDLRVLRPELRQRRHGRAHGGDRGGGQGGRDGRSLPRPPHRGGPQALGNGARDGRPWERGPDDRLPDGRPAYRPHHASGPDRGGGARPLHDPERDSRGRRAHAALPHGHSQASGNDRDIARPIPAGWGNCPPALRHPPQENRAGGRVPPRRARRMSNPRSTRIQITLANSHN